ncbi:rhamnogalacturonan acetylesterase [Coprinopsis cinerea okayama7|uniref:Rhamnogalacturonan acetylesterase n=1 Tax=Coprinopsis cinerea (strain Okayama-7 / 130 / ATCC MYA-4618 / FGSC 9003) TaxID=240176 RepID=A8N2V3_COPC7|nr:rhamnogalacturonan acetylesterase [Coprinopsis cinerea okayama7\|eukprot:XP_001829175.2 rhamnogalacturonan acetylesterase [Coprinopsis cinerea okayama7\
MARGNGVTEGWGQYLQQFMTVPVSNHALGGRSSRSFTEEGRFNAIVNQLRPGDYVVIAFGHNDGSAGAVDNGRQCAVGDGYDTTATVRTSTGQSIVIHSFPYYMQNAVNAIKAKGGIPIVASQTPRNGWTNGSISPGNRFVGYAKLVAERTGVTYIDHYAYVAQAYKRLGQSYVNTFYPNDPVHTSPAGANVVAQAFVRGLLCSNNSLRSRVNGAGQNVPDRCL